MKFSCIVVLFLAFPSMGLFTQSAQLGESRVKIVHRYDFRTRLDGKYAGLVYGGALGVLTFNSLSEVKARFFLEEEGLKNTQYLEKHISNEEISTFQYDDKGRQVGFSNGSVPLFRNFPYHPPEKAWAVGSTWVSSGEIILDWNKSGIYTRVPILTEYKIVNLKTDEQSPYWEISGLHALRYKQGGDPAGSPSLTAIQGKHESLIHWPVDSTLPKFFRIKTEEVISSGGSTLTRNGFWLTWYNGVLPMGLTQEKEKIETQLHQAQVPEVEIQEKEAGLNLVLKNLQFVADEAKLLPGEGPRLEFIAQVLRGIPRRSILITGHTADIGQDEAQKSLSLDRAKAIVDALKTRGVEPKRLYFEGKGADQPIADNATAEGRALNRRVEITILED